MPLRRLGRFGVGEVAWTPGAPLRPASSRRRAQRPSTAPSPCVHPRVKAPRTKSQQGPGGFVRMDEDGEAPLHPSSVCGGVAARGGVSAAAEPCTFPVRAFSQSCSSSRRRGNKRRIRLLLHTQKPNITVMYVGKKLPPNYFLLSFCPGKCNPYFSRHANIYYPLL